MLIVESTYFTDWHHSTILNIFNDGTGNYYKIVINTKGRVQLRTNKIPWGTPTDEKESFYFLCNNWLW
jgi:hypothetical protein